MNCAEEEENNRKNQCGSDKIDKLLFFFFLKKVHWNLKCMVKKSIDAHEVQFCNKYNLTYFKEF